MENTDEIIRDFEKKITEMNIRLIEKRKANYLEYQNKYETELTPFAKVYISALDDIIEILK